MPLIHKSSNNEAGLSNFGDKAYFSLRMEAFSRYQKSENGAYQNFTARKHHLQGFIGIYEIAFAVHPPCVHIHFQLAVDVHCNAGTYVVTFDNVVKHQVLYMCILGRDESAHRRGWVRAVEASQCTRVRSEVAFIQNSKRNPCENRNTHRDLSPKRWSSDRRAGNVAFLRHSVEKV
jgi:hypothetical protein